MTKMAQARPIDELTLILKDRMTREMLLRAGRAVDYLISQIQQAYKFKVNSAGGAASSLVGEVKRAKDTIEMLIGTSLANSYLANMEFGEKGTQGGPADAVFIRRKAPPIKNIYDWLKLASITTPKKFVERAELMADYQSGEKKAPKGFDISKPWFSVLPQMQFALAIAMRRKAHGFQGLHVIEKTVIEKADKIKAYLQGA
jgi:hypothetical protein